MEYFKLRLIDKKELQGTANKFSISIADDFCIVGTTKELYKINCN